MPAPWGPLGSIVVFVFLSKDCNDRSVLADLSIKASTPWILSWEGFTVLILGVYWFCTYYVLNLFISIQPTALMSFISCHLPMENFWAGVSGDFSSTLLHAPEDALTWATPAPPPSIPGGIPAFAGRLLIHHQEHGALLTPHNTWGCPGSYWRLSFAIAFCLRRTKLLWLWQMGLAPSAACQARL